MIWAELEASTLAVMIKESGWLLPVLQSVHLSAMALLGGAEFVINSRLLGFGLTRESPRQLLEDCSPWLRAGLSVLVLSGSLIFITGAFKLSGSSTFRLKGILFVGAVAFAFGVRNPVAARVTGEGGGKARVCAGVSLALWLGVAAAGRWIGFA